LCHIAARRQARHIVLPPPRGDRVAAPSGTS